MLKTLLLAAIVTLSLATGYHAASERADATDPCRDGRENGRQCHH